MFAGQWSRGSVGARGRRELEWQTCAGKFAERHTGSDRPCRGNVGSRGGGVKREEDVREARGTQRENNRQPPTSFDAASGHTCSLPRRQRRLLPLPGRTPAAEHLQIACQPRRFARLGLHGKLSASLPLVIGAGMPEASWRGRLECAELGQQARPRRFM